MSAAPDADNVNDKVDVVALARSLRRASFDPATAPTTDAEILAAEIRRG